MDEEQNKQCRECGEDGAFSVTVRGKVYRACRDHVKTLPSLQHLPAATRSVVASMTRNITPGDDE